MKHLPIDGPSRWRRSLLAASAVLLPLLVQAAEPALFAAPQAAPVAPATGGALRVVLSLILVVGAVFGAAWLARRLRQWQSPAALGIEILAQASLGAKERAVLLRVHGQQILVGVAPGHVQTLHRFAGSSPTLPAGGVEATASAGTNPADPEIKATFRSILRRSLGQ